MTSAPPQMAVPSLATRIFRRVAPWAWISWSARTAWNDSWTLASPYVRFAGGQANWFFRDLGSIHAHFPPARVFNVVAQAVIALLQGLRWLEAVAAWVGALFRHFQGEGAGFDAAMTCPDPSLGALGGR